MKILLTGASSGIGLDLALALARKKKNDFIYVTTHYKEEIKIVKEKVDKLGLANKITCFKLDVTKKKDRNIIKKLDLDCLVLHAATGVGGSILDLGEKDLLNGFDVNVLATVELIKLFLKRPNPKNKKKTILVTSSLIGIMPVSFLGVYSATKASLISIMTSLRQELKHTASNIKIKLIEPGAYKTGFNDYMIAKVESSINKNSLFYSKKEEIIKKMCSIFNVIEKKNTRSIVKKMCKAIYSENNKLVYRSPLLQVIGTKLYTIFLK